MKTKQQILKETLEYYHANPSRRAYNSGGGCEYLTEDGKMCAFGRCEIEAKNAKNSPDPEYGEFSHPLNQSVLKRFNHDEYQMNKALKEEYRGHSLEFWSDVQNFHDSKLFWNTTGVSIEGLNQFNKLMIKWV